MQFEKILDHSTIKKQLRFLVDNNRLSHSFLFLGKRGSGALPLAIAFAQYILCEKANPQKSPSSAISLFGEEPEDAPKVALEDSCGTCTSCIQIEKLAHPDLHFSFPALKRNDKHSKVVSTDYMAEWREFIQAYPYGSIEDWSDFLKTYPSAKVDKGENKQLNISVNECEAIVSQLRLKAFQSDYKIMILWMPEYLGAEGNKLLKTIEEPAPNTIFILVAEDEDKILPTILSRTQLVKIPDYSNEAILDFLTKMEVPEEQAKQITFLSEGNFRDALRMVDQGEDLFQDRLREWLNAILKYNVTSQLKWIEDINKTGREKQIQFLKYFLHLTRQAIKVRFDDSGSLQNLPEKEIDFAARLNKMCAIEALEAIIEEIDRSVYHIERNANSKMVFHSLTIRLFYIIRHNSLILVN